MTKAEINAWQKLDGAAKKLEREVKSPKLQKASQVYQVLAKAPGEQILYLVLNSEQRIVQDRIRNYFQKYLPASLEITDEVVRAAGVTPGTPKYQRVKEELILARLDARPKKPAPAPEPPGAPRSSRGPASKP